MKEEKSRAGGNFDGHTTLRRNTAAKVSTRIVDSQKLRQQHADSGYSTSDGSDKRLWHDVTANGTTPDADASKWSPTAAHNTTLTMDQPSPTMPSSTHSSSFAGQEQQQQQQQQLLDNSTTDNQSPTSEAESRSNGSNNNTRFVEDIHFLFGHLTVSDFYQLSKILSKEKKNFNKLDPIYIIYKCIRTNVFDLERILIHTTIVFLW